MFRILSSRYSPSRQCGADMRPSMRSLSVKKLADFLQKTDR